MLAPAWKGNTLEVKAEESGVQGSLWLQRECEASRNLKANGVTGERKENRTQGGSQFSTTALQAKVLTGFLYPAKLLIKGGLPHSNLENKRQRSNAYEILKKKKIRYRVYTQENKNPGSC